MTTERSGWARARARVSIAGVVLGLLLAAGAAWAAEVEGDSAAAPATGTWYTFEATSTIHHVSSAYFGCPDFQPTDDPNKTHYTWGEGLSRVRVGYRDQAGFYGTIGGVVMGTRGTDYFGTKDVGDGRLDQLLVGGKDLGGSGFGFVLGRQSLQIGDGFVIGDGYYDSKAALWNLPLSFYDGVRLDWARGPWSVTGFATNLSRSFHVEDEPGVTRYPKGTVSGGEVQWSQSEQRTLALAYFQRDDSGDTKLEPRAGSLRGALGQGPVTLSGEWVIERGTEPGADIKATGGHVCLNGKLPFAHDPFVELEYLRFSGDNPETPEDEAYYPWQYTWGDWSKWYVGDLMASTLVFNSDSRIWRLGCGITPLENTTVRLLYHRIDLDSGASWGGLPEGVGRGFADEADLVVDQSIGDHWSAWVMGAYATPREAAKELVGSSKSGQIFGSVTFKFGQGGEE